MSRQDYYVFLERVYRSDRWQLATYGVGQNQIDREGGFRNRCTDQTLVVWRCDGPHASSAMAACGLVVAFLTGHANTGVTQVYWKPID